MIEPGTLTTLRSSCLCFYFSSGNDNGRYGLVILIDCTYKWYDIVYQLSDHLVITERVIA